MQTPATDPPPVSFSIPPLPEKVYDSYDEAEAALHTWNRSQGVDVTKGHHKKNSGGDTRQRDFKCDRYGRTQNNRGLCDEDRVRPNRGTSKIGCKMKIRLEAVDQNHCSGKWKVIHLQTFCNHNHPASEDPSIHPGHRKRDLQRLTSPELSTSDVVASQIAVGIAPELVVATLRRADPNSSIIAKDISNRKGAERRERLSNDTPTESLLKRLSANGFFYKVEVNPDTSRLRYLFWSHPGIKKFYTWNSHVLILDCTYKTNVYDLPLLNIIAMTNMNTVLPIAQCWLPGEKEEDFVWALDQLKCMMESYGISEPSIILTDRALACMNALDVKFPDVPSLVCRWHMNRNVLAKTRTIFGQVEIVSPAPGQDKYENTVATDQFMQLYYDCVASSTEAEFDERCNAIRSASVEMADYLDLHWWKYKEKLVKCWTCRYLHFGYRDTSPVEGTHAKCKRWLESSRGDLLTAFEKLLPWWETCIKNTSVAVERDVGKVSHVHQDERYSAVVMYISRFALDQTAALWKSALQSVRKQNPVECCTGVFRRSNGRPCVHDLIEIIKSERQLKLKVQQFHKHWLTRRGHLERPESRILEPAPFRQNKSSKRRKTRKKNQGATGTAREPTYSERVDLNHPAPYPPPMSAPSSFTELLLSSTSFNPYPASFPVSNRSAESQAQGDQTDPPQLQAAFLPARTWGYAGRRPY